MCVHDVCVTHIKSYQLVLKLASCGATYDASRLKSVDHVVDDVAGKSICKLYQPTHPDLFRIISKCNQHALLVGNVLIVKATVLNELQT
jgi:hypothetical protein